MTKFKVSSRLQSVYDEDEGTITTKLGECDLFTPQELDRIIKYINLPECKVDMYIFNEVPYLTFSSLTDWKHKYYTLNLFTLTPTKTSNSQAKIPLELYQEYIAQVEYEPKSNLPSKEQMTELLFSNPDGGILVW